MDFCGHFIYRYPYHDKRGVMNRTFVHNVLSIMTITRERQSDYSERKTGGAVTYVLVNDPSRGHGIFIENMLEAAG